VRSDVSWCTQCYSALLPEPDGRPQPEDRDDAGPDDAATGDIRPDAEQEQLPGHEREGRQGRPGEPVDQAEVERLAAQMLAQLADQPDELRGLTSRLPATAATRGLAVAAVILVGSAVVLALMFVVGSVL
jgi:hypothetical protein